MQVASIPSRALFGIDAVEVQSEYAWRQASQISRIASEPLLGLVHNEVSLQNSDVSFVSTVLFISFVLASCYTLSGK